MRYVLLGVVWVTLALKGAWFVRGGPIPGFHGKLWILLAVWAMTVAAAALFGKVPVLLPLFGCFSLICQFALLESRSLIREYPRETLIVNLPGILLAVSALLVYRYRSRPVDLS